MGKVKYKSDGDPIENKPLWMMEPMHFIPYYIALPIITFVIDLLIAVFAVPDDKPAITFIIIVLAIISFLIKMWDFWWQKNEKPNT